MRYDEFKELMTRRPFKPVRVFITSGETVDVHHPEQVLVARSMFAFAVGPRKNVVRHVGWYNLVHVVKVVPLRSLKGRHRRQSSA